MRSVRDLKNQVQQEAGGPEARFHPSVSRAYADYWKKLNRLGSEKKTKKSEECQDIDATAFLTEDEYAELLAEFRALLQCVVH